jgi:Chromo (CHRromatin Organisation MOdifier) domain
VQKKHQPARLVLMESFKVGESVQAKDHLGYWLDAKVLERRSGDGLEVLVHFKGWARHHDEWIKIGAGRLLAVGADIPHELPDKYQNDAVGHLGEDQFEVESVLKVRKRGSESQYLVRFSGYSSEHDLWVAEEDVDPSFVAEFHLIKARKKLMIAAPREPYVHTVVDSVALDVYDSLIREWYEDIGRKAASMLLSQREEFACRRLVQMSPCPPWLFTALHRRFVQVATIATQSLSDGGDNLPITFVAHNLYITFM